MKRLSRKDDRIKTENMVRDRIKGLTYGQIALKYKSDCSTVRKRILGIRGYPKVDVSPLGEIGKHV